MPASKTSLVLLHGFSLNEHMWNPLLPYLGNEFSVFSGVIHGHEGKAKFVRQPLIHSYWDEVESLKEWILNTVPPPRMICGYSLGGRLSYGLLTKYSELFQSAVLIAAHPGLESEKERKNREITDRKWAQILREDGMEAFIDRWEKQPIFASLKKLESKRYQQLKKIRLSQSSEGLVFALETFSLAHMPSFWESLTHLTVPLLYLAGEKDEKFCEIGRKLVSLNILFDFQIILNSGHNLPFENPKALAQALDRFQVGLRL